MDPLEKLKSLLTTEEPKGKISVLPLTSIIADFDWNCRMSIGDDVSGAPEEQHRFEDLVESIAGSGQDTPVVVREVRLADGKHKLIAGFRRYRAIEKLWKDSREIPGLEKGTIRVEVRAMSDSEAEALNGRENIARENLNVPDIARLVVRLKNRGLSDASIGMKLGISQMYANRLRHIHDALKEISVEGYSIKPKSAFDYWRERPYALSVAQAQEIVKAKPEDRERTWKHLLAVRASGRGRAMAVAGKAIALVQALVRLEHVGLITLKAPAQWETIIECAHLVPIYNLNDEEKRKLATQCVTIAEDLRETLRE